MPYLFMQNVYCLEELASCVAGHNDADLSIIRIGEGTIKRLRSHQLTASANLVLIL